MPILIGAMMFDTYFYSIWYPAFGSKTWIWTISWYNFAHFNIIKSLAAFYGIHQWHWYITQGLPVVLTTFFPPLIYGVWISIKLIYSKKSIKNPIDQLVISILFFILLLSFVEHKEFRFLMPIISSSLIIIEHTLFQIWKPWTKNSTFCFILIIPQIAMLILFGRYHQSGIFNMMYWLQNNLTSKDSVTFLMPCHSQPGWDSWMISTKSLSNVKVRWLTCEPPLNM